jgi:hypothetical protein
MELNRCLIKNLIEIFSHLLKNKIKKSREKEKGDRDEIEKRNK